MFHMVTEKPWPAGTGRGGPRLSAALNPGGYKQGRGTLGAWGGCMLLVLELDVADLAATRFAISPLCETLRAVALLGRPDPPSANRPWVQWARGELERRPLRLPRLWPLVVTDLPYWPEFLVPAPAGKSPGFEDELARMYATPDEPVRASLRRVFGAGQWPDTAKDLFERPRSSRCSARRGPGCSARCAPPPPPARWPAVSASRRAPYPSTWRCCTAAGSCTGSAAGGPSSTRLPSLAWRCWVRAREGGGLFGLRGHSGADRGGRPGVSRRRGGHRTARCGRATGWPCTAAAGSGCRR